MVKARIVIARSPRRIASQSEAAGATRQSKARLLRLRLAMTVCLGLGFLFLGCSMPATQIPDIPKDHPANKFYQAAQQGMLSDKVCRDNRGNPAIPAGKIAKGEGYTKFSELMAGVFRFRENATGKKYLGVSFLQYSGFLQIPKVCAWEDEDRG